MDIANLLNAGLRRPGGDDQAGTPAFTRGMVRYLLTNPVYAGYVRYRGVLTKADHQPIITLDEHQTLLRLRVRYDSRPRCNRRSDNDNPFAGVIFCGSCNGPMDLCRRTTYGKSRATFRCRNRKLDSIACGQLGVPLAEVVSTVMEEIGRLSIPGWLLGEALATCDPSKEIGRLRVERHAVRQRLVRARNLFLHGELSDVDWSRERARAAANERRLSSREDSTRNAIAGVDLSSICPLASFWVACDPAEQRLLLRLLFARIVVEERSVKRIDRTQLAVWLDSTIGSSRAG
jgi:hypothetical protein